MKKLNLYAAVVAIPVLAVSLEASAKDKEVVVVNTPLEVTGEVTGTVSGEVDATVTNTVDVNVTNAAVPVDVVNMIDVQSMPAVQVAPSQVISAGPPLAPGPITALGLTCVAGPSQNGVPCEYTNPAREGVIVTHISMSPLVSTLGTSGTVCRANAAVGSALLDHSWAADQPAGTHIVLPFSVQVAAPRVPRVFVSKSGDVTKSCAVGVVFHGYRLQ
jgi:hypothetical protein